MKVHWDLIASVEYRQLHQIYREIQEMAPPPYLLKEKEKELTDRTGGGTASILEPGGKGGAFYPTLQRTGGDESRATVARRP